MDTLGTQVYAFLITIATGFSVGICFDLYRVIRGSFRPRHYMTTVMDVLFWLILTPIVVIQLIVANWLELRFYVFLGLGLGLFLYFTVFSPLVLSLVIGFTRIVGETAMFLVNLVASVFRVPMQLFRGWSLRVRFGRGPVGKRKAPRSQMRWKGGWLGRLIGHNGR